MSHVNGVTFYDVVCFGVQNLFLVHVAGSGYRCENPPTGKEPA